MEINKKELKEILDTLRFVSCENIECHDCPLYTKLLGDSLCNRLNDIRMSLESEEC